MSFIAFLFATLLPAKSNVPTPEKHSKPPIVLWLGEQRELQTGQIQRFSVGSGDLRVTYLPQKKSVLVKATKPGASSLWVWFPNGQSELRSVYTVASIWTPRLMRLTHALQDIQGVEYFPLEQKILVRGELKDARSAGLLQSLIKTSQDNLVSQARLSTDLIQTYRRDFLHWKEQHPKTQLEWTDHPTEAQIQGQVDTESDLRATRTWMEAEFPMLTHQINVGGEEKKVAHFSVVLLEILSSKVRNLGVEWPPSIPVSLQLRPLNLQSPQGLESAIQALASSGDVEILARPELVVSVPGQANLFSGGELPIKMTNKHQTHMEWKHYGLKLDLKVKSMDATLLSLEVKSTVSELDPTTAIGDVPGLRSNEMSTEVHAPLGEPLLLCGLLQRRTTEQSRGVPGLHQIPLIGSLFGEHSTSEMQRELVAVLTPHRRAPRVTGARLQDPRMPEGPVPPPRHWLSNQDVKNLEESEDYPWNLFNDAHPSRPSSNIPD